MPPEAPRNPGSSSRGIVIQLPSPLAVLTPEQISRVDQALARVGQFGEVRLIVQRGRLRFVQILRSEDVDNVEA